MTTADLPRQPETLDDLLAAVEEMRPLIERHSAEGEERRALADEVYYAMLDAGLFRVLAPKAYGGLQLHPIEAYRLFEEVAKIDSAAGWNLQISLSAGLVAGPWFPAEGMNEVFASGPDTIFAGALFPPGASVRVEGGWRVTARTPFASGCQRAEWFLVPIVEVQDEASAFDPKTEDPPSICVFIPRDEIDVLDTWHTMGMRATHSGDLSIDDVFVPNARVGSLSEPQKDNPAFADPIYRVVPWVAIQSETAVSIGVASAAIDKLVELAARKSPAYSRTSLRAREMAQHHAGKARALVDASRDALYSSITAAIDDAGARGHLTDELAMRCQGAAAFAADACAQAVDLVFEAAGGSGIRIEKGIERHFRDIHTLTQHASKSYARFEDLGKMMFGLEPDFFALKVVY